ncbi:MAG TPA: threonine synthase [Chitinophagaceae bacterium]|nr:threonine synthase [Chitinophagaceae bacterium]
MKYYSLNRQSPAVDFREATLRGQAPDGGLYFPEHIPVLEPVFFDQVRRMQPADIAFQVIRPYVGASIPDAELQEIAAQTVDFPMPLVQVNEQIYSLELFHGPTLAFKDVGARFMSRCLGYFSRRHSEKIIVLVATSGDTGGAVASGFYGVEGVEVVILYPSGKVSAVQEKQLTTLGRNIHALEVEGSFDDCQQLVKRAFADTELTSRMFLTSANSINVARWLPQQFYYFLAWKQWPESTLPVISVPSGNFGNLCAGMLAYSAGLPVRHFIAACNANDVVPSFLQTGNYAPRKAVATLSNAMDVGDPSNFIRILELFSHRLKDLREVLSGYTIDDDQTRATIRRIFRESGYLLDPHGAVGYLALEQYLKAHAGFRGFFLETAHPVKFFDVVEPVIGEVVPQPPSVQARMALTKQAEQMLPRYEILVDFLRRITKI